MVEGKQTRPSDPEELIRLSAKSELLPCYYCGGEGKLYELNVFGNMIFGIQCEKCAEKLHEFIQGKGKEECSGRS